MPSAIYIHLFSGSEKFSATFNIKAT